MLALDRTACHDNLCMSQVLQIELPDEVFLGMQKDPERLAAEMRVAAAVKWYEMGMLSQGKAAEVAGLSRAAFIYELGHFGVSPFQETAEEILESVNRPGK
jgi:predicted HTH domain antitoxin